VFLKLHERTGELIPAWGSASLYDVSGGTVRGLSDKDRSLDGFDARDVIAKLRARR
jgi:hypothetical protein